jgi:hypothetical protein
MEALQQHQQLCDELHQLALDENHFLQQHRRAPDAPLLERKRALLGRLDETLAALRTASREGVSATSFRQAVEKTRSRIQPRRKSPGRDASAGRRRRGPSKDLSETQLAWLRPGGSNSCDGISPLRVHPGSPWRMRLAASGKQL